MNLSLILPKLPGTLLINQKSKKISENNAETKSSCLQTNALMICYP